MKSYQIHKTNGNLNIKKMEKKPGVTIMTYSLLWWVLLMSPLPSANSEEHSWINVCQNSRVTMAISGDSKRVTPIRESGASTTVFVDSLPRYDLNCSSEFNVSLAVSFNRLPRKKTNYQPQLALASIKSTDMSLVNPVNSRNTSVLCHTPTKEVLCKVNLIVINQENLRPDCKLATGLNCNVSQWSEVLKPSRAQGGVEIIGRGRVPTPQRFNSSIKYSFFDQESGDWIYCLEKNSNGTIIGISSHTESDTKTIQCPIEPLKVTGPVIIRIEQVKHTELGVAMPVLASKKAQISYTFLSIRVNSTIGVDDLTENNNVSTIIIFSLVAVIVIILVLILLVFLYRKLVRKKGSKTKFYADIDLVNSKCSKENEMDEDSRSMITETTSAYERLQQALRDVDSQSLLELFGPENEHFSHNLDKDKFKTILKRQLSGDPSKINPDLSLNQQISALSYNPKLEIDRANFEVGSILGSGNFGSVYVGNASGLFYPGSSTKVAIKTVNDSLDMTHFTALLCEMKILANLDLHLNLVNLMGSCTTEIDDAKLWLLLEFCPHGDLKTFLIQNREQFRNNIKGLVATELDSRLFLKWSHSIAKGMEYLSFKRIMHGDLAARNILIGDKMVAKVGDFGLSKSMYDNIRYKKQKRSYVPWKWMALEYLRDGCFTLKSDVWSYGVVLWELLSLGQEPYMAQSVQEVVMQVQEGRRLGLPDEVKDLEWSDKLYGKVMLPAWNSDVEKRISFENIVSEIELLLDSEEMVDYGQLAEQYDSMKKLMFDEITMSKRSTLSPRNSYMSPESYQKVSLDEKSGCISLQDAYLDMNHINRLSEKNSHVPQSGGYISINVAKGQDAASPNPPAAGSNNSGYISVQAAMQQQS